MTRWRRRAARAEIVADQKLIAGVEKHLSGFASLSVGGQVMTPAELVKVFQDRIVASKAVEPAEAARDAAVTADRETHAKSAKLVSSLRRIVLGMFSENAEALATFGVKAPKVPSTPDVETKKAAVAKRLATRRARHTMGPKQKQKITGAATPDDAAPPKG